MNLVNFILIAAVECTLVDFKYDKNKTRSNECKVHRDKENYRNWDVFCFTFIT